MLMTAKPMSQQITMEGRKASSRLDSDALSDGVEKVGAWVCKVGLANFGANVVVGVAWIGVLLGATTQ